MTLTKVERRGNYQGVPQWGITGQMEITPSRATAQKWARLENANRSAVGRSKAKKARKLGESISYKVYIIGWAWGGFEGTYSYMFDHAPKSVEEVRKVAGDFEYILDWEVQETRTIRYTDGERRIVRTVRPWANESSIDKYCDASGC